MRENEIQEIERAEEVAALMMINFGKSNRTAPTDEETAAVERAMELAGCNTDMGRADRRRIEATAILRDCISRSDRAELRKIETALMEIAAK